MLQGFISPNMDHMLSHALLDNNIPPSQMWCFPESSVAMEAILSQASLGLCNISPSDYQTLAHFGVLYPAIDEGMDESGCMIRKPTDCPSKTVAYSSLGSVDHMPPGVSHSSKPNNMLSAFENSKEQTGICSISAKRRSWREALSNSLETLVDKQELASLKLNIEEDMSPLTLNAPVFANDPKSTVPSLALPCNIIEDTSQEYPPYSLESPSMGTDCHIVEPFSSSKLVNHMQDGVNPNLSTDHVSCMGKKLNGDMMQGFAADWRESFGLYGNKCLSNQSKDDVMSGHEYISHSSSTLVKSIKKEDDNRQLHENGTMDIKDVMASMSGSDQSRKRHAVAANLPSSTPYSKRAHLQPIAPALLMSTGLAATTTTSTTTAGTASTTTRSSKSSSRTRQGPALNTNGKPRAQQGSANDPQSVAARNRRERINARLKVLQELVPDGSKVDLVTMLEKAINYVKCLQLQLRVLSNDDYWQAMNQENDTADHEHGGTAAKTRSEEGQSTTHHQAPKKADEEQYNNYCTYP